MEVLKYLDNLRRELPFVLIIFTPGIHRDVHIHASRRLNTPFFRTRDMARYGVSGLKNCNI